MLSQIFPRGRGATGLPPPGLPPLGGGTRFPPPARSVREGAVSLTLPRAGGWSNRVALCPLREAGALPNLPAGKGGNRVAPLPASPRRGGGARFPPPARSVREGAVSLTLPWAGAWGNPVSPYPCWRARPSRGRGDGETRFPHPLLQEPLFTLQDSRSGGARGGIASPHAPFPARGGQAAGLKPPGPPPAGGQPRAGGGPQALHLSLPEGDRVTPVTAEEL